KCEALPLIQHYDLKYHADSDLFNVYANEPKHISLTITGIGKLASAAGTIYTYTLLDANFSDIWLNVGIAGHCSFTIGDVYLANRIEDAGSGQVWYPQIVIDKNIPTANLLTLDRPSTKYDLSIFDMEASGFISVACRFATAELIHSVKIISDNKENPAGKFNPDMVSKLIDMKKEEIQALARRLEDMSVELKSDIDISDEFRQFSVEWHFSKYQQLRLKQLIFRWHLLMPESSAFMCAKKHCANSTAVLETLQDEMDAADFFLERRDADV
ncbi:MAG: nucleoside phosphorylase, partial [Gammaproteobacteria bacterium]